MDTVFRKIGTLERRLRIQNRYEFIRTTRRSIRVPKKVNKNENLKIKVLLSSEACVSFLFIRCHHISFFNTIEEEHRQGIVLLFQ